VGGRRRGLRHERRVAPGNLGGLGHSGESSRTTREPTKPPGILGPWPRAPPNATTTPSSRSG
jgi:hypothetical protein